MRHLLAVVAGCLSLALTACGLAVPPIEHDSNPAEANALFVQTVTTHVRCELRNAVLSTYDELSRNKLDAAWLTEWSAKVTLTINVDERTGLSPGLTLTRFFPSFRQTLSNGEVVTGPRSFDLGLGGSFAASASRFQEVTWFIVFAELFEERKHAGGSCGTEGRHRIEGDLKIREGLLSGVFPASLERNISNPFASGGRLQVLQHQVSFLIEASGSVTPTWRFVDVSANTSAPLLGGSRNRKDTLLLTMGPTQLEATSRKLRVARATPSAAVESSHFAKQVGNSVADSLIGFR